VKIRTEWNEPPLPTDLTWNPRVYSRVRKPKHRGALVGTLLGVPVDGNACGRAVAYQFQMLTGEIHTVWWDGTMCATPSGTTSWDTPYLYDVDTDELILRNPAGIAWFCRLADVRIPDAEMPV
jgi:hypothetical protein